MKRSIISCVAIAAGSLLYDHFYNSGGLNFAKSVTIALVYFLLLMTWRFIK